MLTQVTLSSGEEQCRLMHTCILDNEGSEYLVAPQLPLALCGDQPGHAECSCVNFTGVHKHMVHTVISIVSSLAYRKSGNFSLYEIFVGKIFVGSMSMKIF